MRFLASLLIAVALVLTGAQGRAMMAGAAQNDQASPCAEMTGGHHEGDDQEQTPCMVGTHCDFCPAAAVFVPAGAPSTIALNVEIPHTVETAALDGLAPQPAAPPPRA